LARVRRLTCILVASSLLLAACDNGGTPAVEVHFGMQNMAACNDIDVSIALESARSRLARRPDGSPSCQIGGAPEVAGCTVVFDVSDDGTALGVDITNCEVTEGDLFSCFFDGVNLAALNASVSGACACVDEPECHLNGATCYERPGICATFNPTGLGCERCSNDVDDDGDGLKDCRDHDCWYNCGVGMTTVTCAPSTSGTLNSSTTSSTTTITLPAAGPASF
jgi:hypothetical protein